MNVLVACEFSGVVRDAFAARGHNAWSCDLFPTERPGNHIVGDVRMLLSGYWDLLIAHPPCTYLSSSGLHWNTRVYGREMLTRRALLFVRQLLDAPIPMIALENPVGCISTRIQEESQYIQPYEFGEDASKKTGLWLKGLPLLQNTERFPGRWVMHKGKLVERWSNQTDSGQNRLGPSETRSAERAKTYQGIAEAMADQWGGLSSAISMPATKPLAGQRELEFTELRTGA